MKIRIVLASVLLMGVALPAFADAPPVEDFQERIAIQDPYQPVAAEESGWNVRLSPGVTVWFFDDEGTEVGPALYMDVYPTDMPLNLRIGVEGVHMDATQDSALPAAEWPGKDPRLSFFRIPLAIEYVMALDEATNLYLGGGPDIFRTANDLSDWALGAHVGARLGYSFTESWGVSVEGGYMWGEVEADGAKAKLDGAYVSPLLTYTF